MKKDKESGSGGSARGRSSTGAPKRSTGAGKPRRGPSSPAAPGSAQRQRLEGELIEAIRELDEEGLLFLLQQAQILVHNTRVDRLNRERQELEEKRTTPAGRGRTAARSARDRAAADQAAPGGETAGAAVQIDEAENRKSFFLALGGVRKALSLQEMQRVVKICYTADSKSAAIRQLYTLFSRERGDILADARIGGPSSPVLDALFCAVRAKYRLEER